MPTIEWEIVIKASAALISAGVAIYQVRSVLPKRRAALRTDLEILKLLGKENPNYEVVKTAIDARIQDIYGEKVSQRKGTGRINWEWFAFGLVWASTFAYLTFHFSRDTFSWWSLLTGYAATAGIGWMMFAVRGRTRMWAARAGWAAGLLRTVVTAQITYAVTYPQKGFASALAELGPPPVRSKPSEKGADLIDGQLASSEKRGYRFTLRPGPPDVHGIVSTFSCTARPLEYERTGLRSFFVDESGIIRATEENRPATADDEPLS